MVGLNYRLRGRDTAPKDTSDQDLDDTATAAAEETVMKSSTVCYNETRGSYSSVMSRDQRGSPGNNSGHYLVEV